MLCEIVDDFKVCIIIICVVKVRKLIGDDRTSASKTVLMLTDTITKMRQQFTVDIHISKTLLTVFYNVTVLYLTHCVGTPTVNCGLMQPTFQSPGYVPRRLMLMIRAFKDFEIDIAVILNKTSGRP